MKVKSIAAFCNNFDLNYAIIGHENQFLIFTRVAVLHRLYCTHIFLFEPLFSKLYCSFESCIYLFKEAFSGMHVIMLTRFLQYLKQLLQTLLSRHVYKKIHNKFHDNGGHSVSSCL